MIDNMNSYVGDLSNIGALNENRKLLFHCFCLSYINFNKCIDDISIWNSIPFYFVAQKIIIILELMAYNNHHIFVTGYFLRINLGPLMNYFINKMYLDIINQDKFIHWCYNIEGTA